MRRDCVIQQLNETLESVAGDTMALPGWNQRARARPKQVTHTGRCGVPKDPNDTTDPPTAGCKGKEERFGSGSFF